MLRHLPISLCSNLFFSVFRLNFRNHNSNTGQSLSEQKGGMGKVKQKLFSGK